MNRSASLPAGHRSGRSIDGRQVTAPAVAGMFALTVHQPHAWHLLTGYKPEEYRGWTPHLPPRTPVLIHAGSTPLHPDDDCLPLEAEFCLVFSAVIGVAWFDAPRPVPPAESGLDPADKLYAWPVLAAVRFDEPIPCRGAVKLWRLPADALK